MTYGQLKDQFGMAHPRPFLHCQRCDARYSAHRGDYFMALDAKRIRCGMYRQPVDGTIP